MLAFVPSRQERRATEVCLFLDSLLPLAPLKAMKLLRGFLRLFFFFCHIQAIEKLFLLAGEQVNGMILPPRVTSLPGSSSLELVLAASLMALASHLVVIDSLRASSVPNLLCYYDISGLGLLGVSVLRR
ncbi:hypothetical protein AMTR_s00008p00160420 [Amborella trichopoda]|uniref:Uncharacterized protein n=1 Tax=Amborella trichopoda TaxID=13333 RepID=W1NIK5_AMBTC|nr:hypothetical protein AMTR_s00008p00160420 [Amborella trichopoda]